MSLTAIYACGIELELIIAKSMTIAVGDRLLMYHNTQAHWIGYLGFTRIHTGEKASHLGNHEPPEKTETPDVQPRDLAFPTIKPLVRLV